NRRGLGAVVDQRGERRATQGVPRARANGARTWRRGFSAAAGEESWPSLAATETWSQEGLETVVVYAVPRTPPELPGRSIARGRTRSRRGRRADRRGRASP